MTARVLQRRALLLQQFDNLLVLRHQLVDLRRLAIEESDDGPLVLFGGYRNADGSKN